MTSRLVAALERLAAHPAVGWAVLALALALRLPGLDKGLWLDEAFSLDVALQPTLATTLAQWNDHPPLFFLLLHAVGRSTVAEPLLRLLPLALSLAFVAVVRSWAGREDPLAGLLAGLLVATLPPFLRIGQELRPYALLALAVAVAAAAAEALAGSAARERGERFQLSHRLAVAVALTIGLLVAVATHHLGLLLVPPLALIALASAGPGIRRRAAVLVAAGALATLLALVLGLAANAQAKGSGSWWMPAPSLDLVAAVARSFVAPVAPSWSDQVQPPLGSLVLESATAGLALAALALSARRSVMVLAGAALLYTVELLVASRLLVPVFWARTAIPALVLLVPAVARGAASIRRPALRLMLAGGLIATSAGFAVRWLADEAVRPLEAWREAAQSLAAAGASEAIVIYPSYAAPALRRELPAGFSSPLIGVPVADAARLAASLDELARPGAPAALALVIRLDLSTLPDRSQRRELLERLGQLRRGRALRALLLVAADANASRELVEARDAVLAELEAALGPPASRDDRGWLVELRFAAAP